MTNCHKGVTLKIYLFRSIKKAYILNMYIQLILGISLFISVHSGNALHYPQYFKAFREEACKRDSIQFFETNMNISGEYPGFRAKSISIMGLWRYAWIDYVTVEKSVNCITDAYGGHAWPLGFVEKLVEGDLDDSVLNLFPENMFSGKPVVIDEHGVSKVENGSFEANSWAITGPQSFTIFDGENFTGNATCLEVDPATSVDGYGSSIDWRWPALNLVVKSAKLGCEGEIMRKIRSSKEQSPRWEINKNKE